MGSAGTPGLCCITGITLGSDGSVLYNVEGLQPAACHTDITGHPVGVALAYFPQSLHLPVRVRGHLQRAGAFVALV